MSASWINVLTPTDFFYSWNRDVGELLVQIKEIVWDEVFKTIRDMDCDDVNEHLETFDNPALTRLVERLRNIAWQNNHFLHNWQTTDEIPQIILPKTFLYILDGAPFSDEELRKIEKIVYYGFKEDWHRFDGRVMSKLCGRDFSAKRRKKMYKASHELPDNIKNRFKWEHILSSYFASAKEEKQSTIPFEDLVSTMEWALDQYHRWAQNMVSDIVFASLLEHPDISFAELEKYFNLAKKLGMGSMRVYNARNKRVIVDRLWTPDDYIEPPHELWSSITERQRIEFNRIESVLMYRKIQG